MKSFNAAEVAKLYDDIAPVYSEYYDDYHQTVMKQGLDLANLLKKNGVAEGAKILDCSCGIGTQAIGLARHGFRVTGCDISPGSIKEAQKNAEIFGVKSDFFPCDMRALPETLNRHFDAVISCGNSFAHMISDDDMHRAYSSVSRMLKTDGVFLAALTDHEGETRQEDKPYDFHIKREKDDKTLNFQIWTWIEKDMVYFCEDYTILDKGEAQDLKKVSSTFRIWRRQALFDMAGRFGMAGVSWLLPLETGHHNPIFLARKK